VPFKSKSFGKTLVTKTTGTKIASEAIKGRVVEQCLADLADNQDSQQWRKIRLILDEVEGHTAKTSFYGMDITRDKLNMMIRKWQSLIECFVDAKSADGYIFRIFVIAFTKRNDKQIRKKAYAKSSHVREIRKKISAYLTTEIGKMSINEIVRNFTLENLTNKITKDCQYVFPLQNVTIRKVKVLKRPKIDVVKMNEMYSHEKQVQYKGNKNDEDESAENLLTKSKARKERRPDGERRPEGERKERSDRPTEKRERAPKPQ